MEYEVSPAGSHAFAVMAFILTNNFQLPTLVKLATMKGQTK